MGDQIEQTSVTLVAGADEPKQIGSEIARNEQSLDLIKHYLEIDAPKQRTIKVMCDRIVSWSREAPAVDGRQVIYIGGLDELISEELEQIRRTIESVDQTLFVLSCDDVSHLPESLLSLTTNYDQNS